MAVQIVDKPSSCCVTVHPLKELDDLAIGQMVRENRTDNEIGAALRDQRENIGCFVPDWHLVWSETFCRLF